MGKFKMQTDEWKFMDLVTRSVPEVLSKIESIEEHVEYLTHRAKYYGEQPSLETLEDINERLNDIHRYFGYSS